MSGLEDVEVRTMRREELAFAVDLAAREGWNPGVHDAECFFAADVPSPDYFFGRAREPGLF